MVVRLTQGCRTSDKSTDRRREQGQQSCTPGLLLTAHPQGVHGWLRCKSDSWRGGCSQLRRWQNPFFYRPPWLLSLSRSGQTKNFHKLSGVFCTSLIIVPRSVTIRRSCPGRGILDFIYLWRKRRCPGRIPCRSGSTFTSDCERKSKIQC